MRPSPVALSTDTFLASSAWSGLRNPAAAAPRIASSSSLVLSRACLPQKHLAPFAFAVHPDARGPSKPRSPLRVDSTKSTEREREHALARNEVATNEGYDVQRDAEAAYSGVTALRGEGGCISKGKGSACTLMCSGDTLPVRRLTVQ